jgi:hypothetical protein
MNQAHSASNKTKKIAASSHKGNSILGAGIGGSSTLAQQDSFNGATE